MNLFQAPPPPGDPDRLALESARVVQRLRTLTLPRLGQEIRPGATRASAAFQSAQRLVDLRAHILGLEPTEIPDLADHAAGDVVAVVSAELIATLRSMPTADLKHSPDHRGADDICGQAVAEMIGLRRAL